MNTCVLPDGLPMPQRGWAMAAILIGTAIVSLEGSIANVALPTIATALDAPPAAAVWVVNAYQLAVVMVLLSLSALGERIGYRKVYLGGLVLFTAGSLACGLAHDLPALIAARAAQGVGGAGIMAVNGALMRFSYPQSFLGRGIGLNALVVSLALVIGPSVAAALLAVADWPWLFLVNVPIGIALFGVAVRALPYSDLSATRPDWISAVLSAVMFGGVFIGSDLFTRGPGNDGPALAVCLLAIGAGILLVRRARSSVAPLIPLDLLAIRGFAFSLLTSVCAFSSYALASVALPFYFLSTLHWSPTQAGLMMTPWPVAMALTAPITGRLSDHVRPTLLGSMGLTVLAAGLIALATIDEGTAVAIIALPMAACGCGFALFQAPNNRILLSTAPRQRAGAASGMLATARLTGLTTGAALAAAVFRVAGGGGEALSLIVAAAFATAGAGVSLLRLR